MWSGTCCYEKLFERLEGKETANALFCNFFFKIGKNTLNFDNLIIGEEELENHFENDIYYSEKFCWTIKKSLLNFM